MRKVIYTAISDSYDTLKDPAIITKEWRYICYTNNKDIKSDVWEIIYLDSLTVKQQRKIKIIPPFEYDLCIWIDGSMKINCDLDVFINTYHSGYFTLMKHPQRNCVYEEAVACIKRKKDDHNVIDEQVLAYKNRGYPADNGMVATGVIVRNNCGVVKVFCEYWWNQVERYSKRDQLSFNVSVYYCKIIYNLIPFDILKTEFILNKHNK